MLVSLSRHHLGAVFDCNRAPSAVSNPARLADTFKIGFLARFGRPLRCTRFEAGGPLVKASLVKSVHTALTNRVPAAGSSEADGNLELTIPELQLAVLSTQLLLEFQTRKSALSMEGRLVDHHSQIFYFTPRQGDYFRTGAPSEPILAEAAAHEMALLERQAGNTADILPQQAKHNLIDTGLGGELVARLILTLAYDRAVL
ncbi:hypothetical protein FRB95_009664 [Tulasnella sp. JGI-2019a]|nr:hypothetical protein FRB95_009664 [Tulasnella sp. JGI-2019a]